MPDRKSEYSWEAIGEVIKVTEMPTQDVVRQAAAWQFHQFVLHSKENPLKDRRMLIKHVETFTLLTVEEMQALRDAHNALPPHDY